MVIDNFRLCDDYWKCKMVVYKFKLLDDDGWKSKLFLGNITARRLLEISNGNMCVRALRQLLEI